LTLLLAVTVIALSLFLPSFREEHGALILVRRSLLPAVIVGISTAGLISEGNQFPLGSLFLLYYCFQTREVILAEGKLADWLFVGTFFLILSTSGLSSLLGFVFCAFYWLFGHFTKGRVEVFLLLGVTLLLTVFGAYVEILWSQYSGLVVIPIIVAIAFENKGNSLSHACLILMALILKESSTELFSGYYQAIGCFLLSISFLKTSDDLRKSLLIALGIYYCFLGDHDPLLVISLAYLIKELIHFKSLLLLEIKKVTLDEKAFSIGYEQVLAFGLLFLLFSGIPFTPVSLIYGLSGGGIAIKLFLIFMDFPLLSLEGSLSKNQYLSSQDGVRQNTLRLFLLLTCLSPLSLKVGTAFFAYQLIPFIFTLCLYTLFKKNQALEYQVDLIYQKLKVPFEFNPTKVGFSLLFQGHKKTEKDLSVGPLSLNGIGSTMIYSFYITIIVMILALVNS